MMTTSSNESPTNKIVNQTFSAQQQLSSPTEERHAEKVQEMNMQEQDDSDDD